MHPLADRLHKAIRKHEFIRAGDRVAAAVSGGADSVAMLLLLLELTAELGIVLSVAHVNHQLRGDESDADQAFVAGLARQHRLEFFPCIAPLDTPPDSQIEARARELRYGFFRRLAREGLVSTVVTAHTLDDQAETVLLRILRGTGVRGLAGIHPRLPLDEAAPGSVVRPLLGFRRAELRQFLLDQGQPWREDSTNLQTKFLRNRVRHVLLPALKDSFGDAVDQNLADLAEIARAEEEHWKQQHPQTRASSHSLSLDCLAPLSLAGQRRLLLHWIETSAPPASVSFRVIEELRDLIRSSPGRSAELSAGFRVVRTRDALRLEAPGSDLAGEYEYSFEIPGVAAIPQLGIALEALIVDPNTIHPSEHDCLLNLGRLPARLTLRNWRAGDRFWPAHTKAPRKVKELLSDRHLAGKEKKLWPVLAAGDDLVWLRGFPVPASFRPPSGSGKALLVRESSLRPS